MPLSSTQACHSDRGSYFLLRGCFALDLLLLSVSCFFFIYLPVSRFSLRYIFPPHTHFPAEKLRNVPRPESAYST
ncbi:hypothetical protein BDV29DRAFT_73923 [Aspergillus leporis]|uniref:Uncharacterized protein n=1 Tax=Aspergillus leporis TaxID=41062 RepID=A0A5N5WI69_9EURO|nr:hypothetical protein BDV29DRAFT_73923 [Aspergillus leporis]